MPELDPASSSAPDPYKGMRLPKLVNGIFADSVRELLEAPSVYIGGITMAHLDLVAKTLRLPRTSFHEQVEGVRAVVRTLSLCKQGQWALACRCADIIRSVSKLQSIKHALQELGFTELSERVKGPPHLESMVDGDGRQVALTRFRRKY